MKVKDCPLYSTKSADLTSLLLRERGACKGFLEGVLQLLMVSSVFGLFSVAALRVFAGFVVWISDAGVIYPNRVKLNGDVPPRRVGYLDHSCFINR